MGAGSAERPLWDVSPVAPHTSLDVSGLGSEKPRVCMWLGREVHFPSVSPSAGACGCPPAPDTALAVMDPPLPHSS